VIVSNAGPLIGLARIGKLSLLQKYFEKIYIPKEVFEELDELKKKGFWLSNEVYEEALKTLKGY
jgi:predicted nucleic acid-binding protein